MPAKVEMAAFLFGAYYTIYANIRGVFSLKKSIAPWTLQEIFILQTVIS